MPTCSNVEYARPRAQAKIPGYLLVKSAWPWIPYFLKRWFFAYGKWAMKLWPFLLYFSLITLGKIPACALQLLPILYFVVEQRTCDTSFLWCTKDVYFICFKVRSISGAQVHSVRRQVRKRRDYINLAKSLKKWVLLKVFPANYNQTSVNLTPGSFKLSLIWLKPTARGHLIFGSSLRVFCFIIRINDTKWNKT